VLDAAVTRPLDVEPQLCQLSGAAAAAVVHSYSGALWLAISALAAGRQVLVARADVGDVDRREPLPKLVAAANATLVEVGTINRATAADYEAAASPRAAVILKLTPDAYRVVGETTVPELDELVAVSRACELICVEALGAASLVDPPNGIALPLRTVRGSLKAGIDLVIVRGDGFVGGPACGILLGSRDVIRRVTAHPLYETWRLEAMRCAALIATLECYGNTPLAHEGLPVWQFLTTTVDNLRNRAERMAAQLAHVQGITSATAVETRSPLFAGFSHEYPSYAVALTVEGDVKSLDRRLRDGALPIVGRIEGERLLLDLRTVLPRQDKTLVDTLVCPTKPDEAAKPPGDD
jgi:L-seryl-tRNA(Ser) seleniumtransferase